MDEILLVVKFDESLVSENFIADHILELEGVESVRISDRL
jgi:hypothetical protein